jgi:hypothetical protein
MLGAVVEKAVRRIVPDRAKRDAAKLEKAVAELRALIQQEDDKKQKAARDAARITSLVTTAQRWAGGAWEIMASGNDEQAEQALRDWAVATAAEERLRGISVNLQRAQFAVDHTEQVLAANPNAKEILLKIVGAGVTNTSAELERVTAREQARLDQEHGVGEFAAEDSPVCKRIASRLEWLRKVQQRVAGEGISVTWPLFAKELSGS